MGNLTLPLTAIECFRAVVNRKKGMQALLNSGGGDLLQIACFGFGTLLCAYVRALLLSS